jgi:putative intracellular protease/amidase
MATSRTVGALLFEGFELMDVFGPLEAWASEAQIVTSVCTGAALLARAGVS